MGTFAHHRVRYPGAYGRTNDYADATHCGLCTEHTTWGAGTHRSTACTSDTYQDLSYSAAGRGLTQTRLGVADRLCRNYYPGIHSLHYPGPRPNSGLFLGLCK